MAHSLKQANMNARIATLFLAAITGSVAQHHNVTGGLTVCARNWTLVGSTCYYVDKSIKASWKEGLTFCEKLGSHLAEPASREENQRLRLSSAQFGDGAPVWIGLIREKDKKIYFQSSHTLVPFKGMKPFPGDKGFEKCLTMVFFGWLPRECSRKQSFICQRQAGAATTPSIATTTPTTTTDPVSSTNTDAAATTTTSPKGISPTLDKEELEVDTTTAMILLSHHQDAESGAYRPLVSALIILQVLFTCSR